MTTADTLRLATNQCDVAVIPTGPWQGPIVHFVANSPLAWCTSNRPLEHGGIAVITDRPITALSTGERLLWELLVSLTGPTGCTPGVDVGLLVERADAVTLATLADLFARLTLARRIA